MSCLSLACSASDTVGIAITASVLATAACSARWPLVAAIRLMSRNHFPKTSSLRATAAEPSPCQAALSRSSILS